jgi:hypothetical protein
VTNYLEIARRVIAERNAAKSATTGAPQPAPAPKKKPWPVRCSLCGSVLPGLVEGVDHFRRVHVAKGDVPKTSENLFGTPKGNGDSK